MSWRSRNLKSRTWRSGKGLEVRPGARIPGDGVQEAEGSEAGGPGARTSGLGAGGVFRGVLRRPSGGAEGLGDLAILGGEPSLPPPAPMNLSTTFFTKSCPVAILGGQGNILVSEVYFCWFSR